MLREDTPSALCSDDLLLRGVLADDPLSWQRFYDRFQPIIERAVMRVLRRQDGRFSVDDLADFAGDVWLALLRDDRRKLRVFDGRRGRKLRSWIDLLATNNTIDRLRTLGAAQQPARREVCDQSTLVDQREPGADRRLELDEQAQMVWIALARLRANERRFLDYWLTDRYEPRDLARELGISVNTVHSRKFKIREKLTRIVQKMARPAVAA